ncbi:sulfotransferase family protein, partial [Methylomagnum sp.]
MKKLFLVGCPRSGTTWLQIILGNHPKIATARETHLFDVYLHRLYDRWDSEEKSQDKDGLRILLSRSEFDGLCGQFASAVMNKIAAVKPGAALVLEKTPGNIKKHKLIKQFFPDAKFLHIVRDPRAVAASLLAAKQEPWGNWAPNDVYSAARMWRDHVMLARRELVLYGNDFKEIRYEDLSNNPTAVVHNIWKWLAIPPVKFDPAEFTIEKIKHTCAEKAQSSPAWENRENFFRRGTVDGWSGDLTRDQIMIIEGITA